MLRGAGGVAVSDGIRRGAGVRSAARPGAVRSVCHAVEPSCSAASAHRKFCMAHQDPAGVWKNPHETVVCAVPDMSM